MATTKISNDNQAALKVLIDEAAGNVTFDKSIVTQGHFATQGLLWNQNKNFKDLVVIEQHDWLGNPIKSYPNPLHYSKQGQPAIFVHQGPRGSKGAVVYADGEDSTARKWIVAFDAIDQKVYVEAGPTGSTDFHVIAVKLSESGSESSYEDPVFHGKAYAEIRAVEGRSILYVWFSN